MTFTFQNVWENRDAFIEACKEAVFIGERRGEAGKVKLQKRLMAKTERGFLRAVYDNFTWINRNIENFMPKFDYAYGFKGEELARVIINKKVGYINKDGELIVPPILDYAYVFRKGIAVAVLNDKIGYIKTDGDFLIYPKFDAVSEFSEDIARVELNGKYGYIKNDGSYLAEPIFDKAFNFKNKNARVWIDKTFYNLDTDGNLKEIK